MAYQQNPLHDSTTRLGWRGINRHYWDVGKLSTESPLGDGWCLSLHTPLATTTTPFAKPPPTPSETRKQWKMSKKNPSLIILFGKCHFRFRCEKPTKNQSEEIHRPPIPTHIDLLASCTVQKIPQAGCRGTRRRRHHHHLPDSDHQTRQREQREQRQYRLRGNRRQANGGNV